jgi:hypothetical protein
VYYIINKIYKNIEEKSNYKADLKRASVGGKLV